MKKLLLSTLLLANGVAVAAPFVVKDIRVDGVEPQMQPSIIASLPIKVGQKATDNDVSNVVKQLFLQNRFKDVSAVREGNTLVVKVVEFPIISKVEVEGNKAIPKDALEQNLKANLIRKGEVFNSEKLEEFKKALIEHYRNMGRYKATVDSEIIPIENGNIDIKLIINEEDVAYVKEISFEGNKSFSSKELLSLLEIKPDVSWWNIFQSSKYEQQVYQKDLEKLRNFYLNNGYAKFSLTDVDTQFSDDKKDVFLTYKINEGEQYNISSVRVLGNMEEAESKLQSLAKEIKSGQQFRIDDISKIQNDIKDELGNLGYASAKVELVPIFNEENKTVQLNYMVDPGRRIYVRKIRFEGNDVTADSTLRSEMRQQESAWFSAEKVNLGKSRLERTGFYDSVDMAIEAVPNTNDQIDLIYKIKERNTGSVTLGIGYGSESGISYQAGIKQDNFLGLGSTISLSGQRNDYGTSINFGYTEPYFTQDGVSLGGNVFYEDYDNSKNSSASSYKRRTYGINGTLGFPVDENNSYYLGLGYVNDKLKNVKREFNRELYINSMGINFDRSSDLYKQIKVDDFDFSLGWNYNSLNRGFFPTEGTRANIGGKITIPGSDSRYYKLNMDVVNYLPLNREHKWVLSSRTSIGYASGFGGRELPFYQTYSAGGIGSLRGFAYGAIGPKAIYRNANGNFTNITYDVVGGNAIATASVELITPTPFISNAYQNTVRTSLFLDIASVWNTKWKSKASLGGVDYDFSKMTNYENYKDYKRLRASTGLAFQWNSPIGPLVFSYAKPLRKYKGDDLEQFQFSIGGGF